MIGGPRHARRCSTVSARTSGLTLLEVLIAMVLLATALLAWVRVQGATLKSERSSRVRRELAAWMGAELSLQRNVRVRACLAAAPGIAWRCELDRTCVAAGAGGAAGTCDVETIRITLAPPSGPPLQGRTAVWWPLQHADVDGPGR